MTDKKYALFPFADSVFYGVVQRETKTKYFVKIGFKPENVPNENAIMKKDMIKLFSTVEECWYNYHTIDQKYNNIKHAEQELKRTIENLRNEK